MKRSFIYLAALTAVAVFVVFVFSPEQGLSGKQDQKTLLLPAITDQINDVNHVEIISGNSGPVATLVKTRDGWQVEELGGYRADWSRLQELLAGLATARVIEVKTDKPEYYSRLGVEDIEADAATSVLVRFGTDTQSTAVLVGKSPQGRNGRYVRVQGVAASALIDKEIEVSQVMLDWAESGIVDIGTSEVAEVELIHPTGERLLVTRVSADQTDFELVDLPADREVQSSWSVNSLGSVFSLLNMESVRPADDVDWSDSVRLRLLMFSGVEIMTELVERDSEHLLRMKASHPAANVLKEMPEDQQLTSEQLEINQRAAEDVAKMVSEINHKTNGWAYVISAYKYEAMVKKPEDLLKPLVES